MTATPPTSESALSPPPGTPGAPRCGSSAPAAAYACCLMIVVSTALSTVRLMEAQPLQSANDRSRWCTVRALVEQGTYRIDDVRRIPGWDTIDLVRYEGHFYSTKPPLLSTLVAGVYWVTRATLGWSLYSHLAGTTRIILVFVNIVPMTVALVLLLRLVRRMTESPATQVFVMAIASFGTLLLPFLTTLNNHTVAAVSLVCALSATARILADGGRSPWLFATSGFFAAFTCCNEIPAAACGVALFAILAWRAPRRTALAFVPAALVPLAAFFYTNYLVTGGLKPFQASYDSELYRFVHEGVPSYWMHPRGIDAARDSVPVYLLHCTFGHHGLFSLTPVWLFAVAGWLRLKSWRSTPLAPLHWTGLGLTLLVFGFYLTRTENYNFGGVSVALRWMIWLTPFWLLALVPAWDGWGQSRVVRTLGCAALAVSVVSAWSPFHGPWKQPWLFTLLEGAGWIDYRDPPPVFERPVHSWIHRLPTAAERDPRYWILLTGATLDGHTEQLLIRDGGPVADAVPPQRTVELVWTTGQSAVTQSIAFGVAAFNAGKPVAEFIVWPAGSTASQRVALTTTVAGIPYDVPYRCFAERYLKFPIRNDAYHCQLGETAVRYRTGGPEGTLFDYRRTVWLCDEVPFGVLQFDSRVTDINTGAMVSRQQLSATRSGYDSLSAP